MEVNVFCWFNMAPTLHNIPNILRVERLEEINIKNHRDSLYAIVLRFIDKQVESKVRAKDVGSNVPAMK